MSQRRRRRRAEAPSPPPPGAEAPPVRLRAYEARLLAQIERAAEVADARRCHVSVTVVVEPAPPQHARAVHVSRLAVIEPERGASQV